MPPAPHQHIIDDLLALPNAPMILNQVSKQLEAEKTRRQNFYNEITDEQKVEFINGERVIHSPVKKAHNDVTSLLHMLVNAYVIKHKLGYVGVEKVMVALSRNDYEPDICFFKQEKAQHFEADQSLFPAPDWVVEVLSKGTEKNDRGIKFLDYQLHEVKEYWLVDPVACFVEQYRWIEGQYELILKSGNGTITSEAITGFRIPVLAMFDEVENLKTLSQLLR